MRLTVASIIRRHKSSVLVKLSDGMEMTLDNPADGSVIDIGYDLGLDVPQVTEPEMRLRRPGDQYPVMLSLPEGA